MFSEIARIRQKSGRILIRDLVRPDNEADVVALSQKYGGGSATQRRLFEDSLHAALSLEEVRQFASDAGLRGVRVEQITDRHWSLESQ